MDNDKIVQKLNSMFAAPLPEFFKRRIVVWYDEDGEFVEQVESLTLTNAKVLRLTGSNNFQAKKTLAVDDPASNYLLYRPFGYESDEDNWLLDVETYSESFRADQISIWMEEMHIQESPALRRAFKAYRKFFNAQARRNKLASFSISVPRDLQLAVMASLAGVKDAKPAAIIKAVLAEGLDAEKNRIYLEYQTYDISDAFWVMVEKITGCKKHHLRVLAAHILLTACTRTMQSDFLTGFGDLLSIPHQSYCYDLVSEWDSGSLRTVAEEIEGELKLPQRFMKLDVLDLVETEIFPCIDEVILVKLLTDIGNHIIDVDLITRIVEKRRITAWFESFKAYYEGIMHVARMQAFYKEHSNGFHTVEPHKVWEEYTKSYYLMDTYYRQFHRCYSDALRAYHDELSDRFTPVKDTVEGLYKNWFLGQLGANWSDACAESLRDRGRIPEIPRQQDFYRSKVAPADSRIYVIISDALRYEVAASLTEQLRWESQAEVQLSSMQGIFPSVTKYGMAALLPHKKLSVELRTGKTDRLGVLADGQSTEAPNRDKVLKSADIHSVALQYNKIITMKRADRQDLVRGMNVVYIYHDVIDSAGHQETNVFSACDTTIEELKNMVRIIANEWGGANILITSDHGFLYTFSPLTEDDKVDKTTESAQDVEVDRRYLITEKGASPQYLLPVKFLGGDTPYDAFAARENVRIKKKGGGSNYVHGGISLQEMVIPLIEYHFLRNQNSEYKKNRSKYDTKPVEIALLSANRKITNMIFSLNFYQKEPLSYNREKGTYQLYFVDSAGKAVSDTALIIADKTSENAQERIYRCSFNLKSQKYSSTESYYLRIADESGMVVGQEEFQIDIAFAVDDFDFFG